MNRTRLRKTLWMIIGCLLIFGILGAWLFYQYESTWYIFYKDLFPVVITILAVYLAYCFQLRASYLQALRELLWGILIPAIQSAIQYTHLSNPTKEEFSVTSMKISSSIDSVRGVFKNVKVSSIQGSHFPFENLKDISKILGWLKYTEDRSDDQRRQARKCIVKLWQQMYFEMLREFDRSPPIRGAGKYLHTDKASISDLLISGDLNSDHLKQFHTSFKTK